MKPALESVSELKRARLFVSRRRPRAKRRDNSCHTVTRDYRNLRIEVPRHAAAKGS